MQQAQAATQTAADAAKAAALAELAATLHAQHSDAVNATIARLSVAHAAELSRQRTEDAAEAHSRLQASDAAWQRRLDDAAAALAQKQAELDSESAALRAKIDETAASGEAATATAVAAVTASLTEEINNWRAVVTANGTCERGAVLSGWRTSVSTALGARVSRVWSWMGDEGERGKERERERENGDLEETVCSDILDRTGRVFVKGN